MERFSKQWHFFKRFQNIVFVFGLSNKSSQFQEIFRILFQQPEKFNSFDGSFCKKDVKSQKNAGLFRCIYCIKFFLFAHLIACSPVTWGFMTFQTVTCVCLAVTYFSYFSRSAQQWSLYTLRNKKETSSSQPCISQNCRPSKFYLVLDKGMLRWYLTVSGLTAFNQSLADQDLSRLLLVVLVRGRVSFSSIKPFANRLFLLEHSFVLWYLWFLLLAVVTDFLSS